MSLYNLKRELLKTIKTKSGNTPFDQSDKEWEFSIYYNDRPVHGVQD